jgi:hypothetical protein
MFTSTQSTGRFVALLPAIWLPLALAMTACGDDEDIIEPLPIVSAVAVFADTTLDFGALHTFALADTVLHFNPATGTPLPVSRVFDQEIIHSVRSNFLARGYVEEANPDSVQPDFIVLISATATENQVAWVNYPWFTTWGFFPGLGWFTGFDNSYGIVYPWRNSVPVTVQPRGTLIVDLIPTLSVNPLDKTVTAAWSGVATGALTGKRTSADMDAAIDQMFLLSPYLRSDTLLVNPL